MPIDYLDRVDDPRLDCFRDLPSHADRPPTESRFIAEGRHCVRQLADCDLGTHAVLVQSGREQEIASWFDPDTDIYVLPADALHQVVGFEFHRGVIACGVRPPNSGWIDHQLASPVALALCGVADRDNLGSIFRTAAALGVRNILCDRRTADPFSRRVIRVSMAHVFGLNIHRCDDAATVIKRLNSVKHQSDGSEYRIVATTLASSATPMDQFARDQRPILLMLGSESDGLEPSLEQMATDRVTIPMATGVDSLNVSVAAAIFMYQLVNLRTDNRHPGSFG